MIIDKKVNVVGTYDVVVCGGGPAGFIAAISAARSGARTCLIERYGFFGGLATAGYVAPISVFSYNGELTIGGIPWEFVKRLEKMGGAYIEQPLNNVSFDFELYKLCAQRMVIESGVTLYMNSYISGCTKDADNRINTVIFENKNGTEAVECKVVIDCSGDADVAFMAGAPMQHWKGTELQPASMCFILSGVDTSSPLVSNCMHHHLQGVNCHCVPVRDVLSSRIEELKLPSFGGPWFCYVLHDGSVAVNMTRIKVDACDNRAFTEAECKLREDVFYFASVLRNTFPEFKNSYVSSVAVQAGPRETRHLLGKHIITSEEYLSSYKYEDSISRCSHPIDIHSASNEKQNIQFLEKAAYIPYSALITETYPNLIVAGRSISADMYSFASIRVQASCMGIGQAAGFAAAIASENNQDVQAIDCNRLREILKKEGAII